MASFGGKIVHMRPTGSLISDPLDRISPFAALRTALCGSSGRVVPGLGGRRPSGLPGWMELAPHGLRDWAAVGPRGSGAGRSGCPWAPGRVAVDGRACDLDSQAGSAGSRSPGP